MQPRWLAKTNALRTAINFSIANNVVGDYLEFGVYRGSSFARAYRWHANSFRVYRQGQTASDSEFLTYRRQFFAFDSFVGLPKVDQMALPLHWRGEHAMGCAEETFLANVYAAGVPRERVTTISGFYDQVLTPDLYHRYDLRRAAVIHIDCDLYESAVLVLDFIYPLLVRGTVIVFDDWFFYNGHPASGEQGAFRAWLDMHPDLVHTALCISYPAAAFVVNCA
jgi:O-methyltransferase